MEQNIANLDQKCNQREYSSLKVIIQILFVELGATVATSIL